jgi:hypothetical protein
MRPILKTSFPGSCYRTLVNATGFSASELDPPLTVRGLIVLMKRVLLKGAAGPHVLWDGLLALLLFHDQESLVELSCVEWRVNLAPIIRERSIGR